MAKERKRMPSAPDNDVSRNSGSPAAVAENGDPRNRIAMRAYELYLARGAADGGDFDDWLAAEREVGRSSGIVPPEDSEE